MLEEGEPILFGPDNAMGVVMDGGVARIVAVADVGLEAIYVHAPSNPNPAAAFALSRLSHGPLGPTPIGVFRSVERETYGEAMQQQLIASQATQGPGDIDSLLRSTGTWTVE
jgi:2-oxoglutarate ferredoxin oxidoreductase subunit beta